LTNDRYSHKLLWFYSVVGKIFVKSEPVKRLFLHISLVGLQKYD